MTRASVNDDGLTRLAEIVKHARGRHSYRDFEALTHVSHTTIRRIELGEVKNPDVDTLDKLSPHTAYSVSELLAIVKGKTQVDLVREYRIAEDVIPMVNELPAREAARLAQMIVARLGGLEVAS